MINKLRIEIYALSKYTVSMRQSNVIYRLKKKLKPGCAYRREDLAPFSTNIDRHLFLLVKQEVLKKIHKGLYYYPEHTAYGDLPPTEYLLAKVFLREDRFVIFSPNDFNGLGFGTTQLYNKTIVFNRKRSGWFNLAGHEMYFHKWREAPKKVTIEFLIIQMLNNLKYLAEDVDKILKMMQKKLHKFDLDKIKFNAEHYGTYSTQKTIKQLIKKADNDKGFFARAS